MSCWAGSRALATPFSSAPSLLPGEMFSERTRLDEGFLRNRLQSALAKLNAHLPAEAIEEAFRKVTMAGSPHLYGEQQNFSHHARGGR